MPAVLLLLALGLAANVALGPLGLGLLQWRLSADLLNQTYGADGATLVLAVPAALAAAWLWRGRHRQAAPLALGVGLYALYYAVAETLGADYRQYAGNNERFFPLFLALVILSCVVAARAWAALESAPAAPPRWLGRVFAVVLVLGGAVIGVAWSAQILRITATGALPPGYLESPGAFWVVRIVDLGFIAPVALWAGVGLWRGSAAALKAAYGLASFLTLQGAAVLVMGAIMLWRGDPTASPGLVVALSPVVLALAALTVWLLGSYAGNAQPQRRRQAAAPARA